MKVRPNSATRGGETSVEPSCKLGTFGLEPEGVVQLGSSALAQRRETLVEPVRFQILPVLGIDEVEVVPGRDDPSRLEKDPDDLRDVIVLDVAGD